MSVNAKRWGGWCVLLILLLVAGTVWRSELYLLDLRREEAVLGRDLQKLFSENQRLSRRIEGARFVANEERQRGGIESAMSRSRGLAFRQPVAYRRMPRVELQRYILGKLESHYTPEEFRNYELALKRLGLFPRDLSLRKTLTDLLSEQVAAFYDPDTHALYTLAEPVRTGLRSNLEGMILAHEVVHALQDQNFDFKALALKAKNNDDAALAAASLLEGDANFHMASYLQENYRPGQLLGDLHLLLSQKNEKLFSAPPCLRDSLTFPYQEGHMFVTELQARGGNAAVDAAFADPPQSTEQILHPEKYFGASRDSPKAVTLPSKTVTAWKKLHENVVGELGIRSFFSQLLGAGDAARVAEGWGGDRYALYEIDAERWVLVWKSVWDTERDAREFFDALEEFYKNRYETTERPGAVTGRGNREKSEPKADSVFFSLAHQKQNLTIRHATVWLLDAPDAETMSRLMQESSDGK